MAPTTKTIAPTKQPPRLATEKASAASSASSTPMPVASSLKKQPPAIDPNFGKAIASQKNARIALDHYDKYCTLSNQPPGIQNLDEADVEGQLMGDLLQGVAEYLSTLGLLPSTVAQYLSKIKEHLVGAFPSHPAWVNHDNGGWYTKLRRNLEVATARNLANKDPDANVYGKTLPLYIDADANRLPQEIRDAVLDHGPHAGSGAYAIDLKSMCDRLLFECTQYPPDKHGPAQQRAWLVVLLLGIGRGGELSLQKYSDMHWDVLFKNVDTLWNESKTLTRHTMLFGPSKYSEDGFLCDFFHALGAFFALEGGLERDERMNPRLYNFLFPELRDLKTDVATIVSNIIKKYVHPDLKESYSSRSIRKGMTTFLNGLIADAFLEYRGGWANGSNLKSYKENNPSQSLPAMNAMGGWSTLHTPKYAPATEWLGSHAATHIESFQQCLYDKIGVDMFLPGRHLRPFLEACTASLLMYFDDVKRRYGSSHSLIKSMIKAATSANIREGSVSDPVKVLSMWGKAIKERFVAINVDCPLPDESGHKEQLEWQHDFNRKMAADSAQVKAMAQSFVRVQDEKMEGLETIVRQQGAFIQQQATLLQLLTANGLAATSDAAPTGAPSAARVSLSPGDGISTAAAALGNQSGPFNPYLVPTETSKRQAPDALQGMMKKARANATVASETTAPGGKKKVTLVHLLMALYETHAFVGTKETLAGKLVPEYGKKTLQRHCFDLAAVAISDEQWATLCTPNLGRSDLGNVAKAVQDRCLALMLQLEFKGKRTTSNHTGGFDGLGARVGTYKANNNGKLVPPNSNDKKIDDMFASHGTEDREEAPDHEEAPEGNEKGMA